MFILSNKEVSDILTIKINYILFEINASLKIYNIFGDEIEIFYTYLIMTAISIC
jgi:hypothetical protein